MIERFRNFLSSRKQEEKRGYEVDEQTGFPKEFREVVGEMVRGERPPQTVVANIDEEGNVHVETVDMQEKGEDKQ